ncbi:uncharacterized protein LOC125239812 isoform X3 [Leguminivora glycinivorella]|uniref:uncharacterized protein LOC125239812 isoform X3 n=1 Tax=Leguminivora glycinivorella TaxID=1035111 RepID=UPI00200E684E|nr:uncharacterized protein LOC125239812 isoform X3 [Leguminivora glycinivorella]
MDVMLACRCCLLCPPDKDLTTPHTHLDKTEIYADMIKECFDIQLQLAVGGSGSSGICCTCVGRLRDASDFKLQVQRSQAELQARSQGASLVKEEESAVECENPEMQDTHETCGSEPGEETAVKPEMLDEDTPEEILYEEFTVKSEASAEDDEISRSQPILPKTLSKFHRTLSLKKKKKSKVFTSTLAEFTPLKLARSKSHGKKKKV